MSPQMNNLPEDCIDNINTFLRRHCISPKMNNLPDDCVSNILKFLRPVRQKENKKQPLASAMFNSYTYTDLMTKGIRPYEDYWEVCLATRHLKYAASKKPIVVELMVGQYYKSNKTTHSWFFDNGPRKINKVPTTETVIQDPVVKQDIVVEVAGARYEGVITKICSKTIHIQCHRRLYRNGEYLFCNFRCIGRRV